MQRRSVHSFVASLGAVAAALLAQPAFAQDSMASSGGDDVQADPAQSGFEEIVVTARKVGETAQSLPITVAAFSGEELQTRGVLTAQDLQAVTPGLTVSNNATGGVPVFAIRGTSTELGIDGGVAIYFNDVPLISTVGIMNSFYDVSTVEILKGPQGTEFGTNTTGGTISVRSNLPTDEFEGYVRAGYGNFNRHEFEGAINIPITDAVKLRLAGNFVKRDGFVKNPTNAGITPKAYQDEDHYSLRGTLMIETGPLENVLIADYYNRDEAPFTPVPVKFVRSGIGLFLPDLGARLGNARTIFQGPNATGVQPDLFGRADLYGIQNRTNLELSDTLSIRNVLGYRHDDTRTSEDTSGTNLVLVNVLRDTNASNWTNDFTLRFDDADLGLRISLGGYYSRLRQAIGLNANVLQGIFGFFGAPRNVISTINLERRETESKAIYINGEYDITDTLVVAGGFRHNWDDVRSNVTAGSALFNPATPLGTLPIFGLGFTPTAARPCDLSSLVGYANFNPVNCTASREISFKAPSWLLSISNNFSDRVLGYAKISHGYLAGGTNFTLRDAGRTFFQPEKNTMIEAGVKADWEIAGRPIRTNLAIYRGRIKNKQVFANANYDGGGTGFGVVNAAKQTVYGADFELRYSPVESLTLDFSYNYINSKFNRFIYPELGGPSAATRIPAVDLSGATPAQTPKHQINGAITYDLPLAESAGDMSMTVSGYYTSSITQANRLGEFDRIAGGELNVLEGYFIANASLNWQGILGSPVSGQLWVRNMFDRQYATGSNIQFLTFGYGTRTFGAPRTYGISLSVEF